MRPQRRIRSPGSETLILAALLLGPCFSPASASQAPGKLDGGAIAVPRHNERAGGGVSAASTLALNATIGDFVVDSAGGGTRKIRSGFISLASQPGSVVSITAVTQSTGSLELSWNAPGLDGFKGDVVDGFYRVDYSSNPDHVFSPTQYVLEFATSVAPGSSQSLAISGLLANTTYYTRIYLADKEKFFAEDSRRSDKSTLANIPVNPFFSGVFATSVTISWQIPVGSAEGYEALASSNNFGALGPGVVTSSATSNGLLLSLSMGGLTPFTTYYFKVASLNWQGEKTFTTVLATVTAPGFAPFPITDLAVLPDAFARTVTLTWKNGNFQSPQVLVLMSTSPVSSSVTDGNAYQPGQTLADSSIVKSTGPGTSFKDFGLALDTSYYYHLYSEGIALTYSVSVSTYVFLDLPPMSVAALDGSSAASGAQFILKWSTVTTNLDGSAFSSPASPKDVELSRYDVYRSTSVLHAGFVKIASVPANAVTYTDTLPNPNQTFLYKVEAVDSLETADASMAIDTNRNLYVFASDGVTHLQIPAELGRELRAGFNSAGSNLLVRVADEVPNPQEKVLRSARFEARKAVSNELVDKFQFSKPATVVLGYKVAGGKVVPSESGFAAAQADPLLSADPENLGLYWFNGAKFIKFYGQIDTANQFVSAQNALMGTYQIRSLFRPKGFSFDISSLSNKFVTPNGDGLNDKAVFVFDNPKDSAFSGKIFDLEGAFVADMAPGPVTDSLQWDGKGNGRPVAGGVYVYQIRAEDRAFTGTLVVIR